MADREFIYPKRRMPQRSRSNFLTRAATDDAAQLSRRHSVIMPAIEQPQKHSNALNHLYHRETEAAEPETRRYRYTQKVLESSSGGKGRQTIRRRSSSGRRKHGHGLLGNTSLMKWMQNHADHGKERTATGPKTGAMPRPVGGTGKLGTFSGVFVPTSLNVLSILMFLRFGFILGQSGVAGMMGMLIVSYVINLVTTLSLSAIATNGTVRGGGAYYLISRSLGPEFGGSIGVVFYLGLVFNTGMNAVGLIDCIKENFGETSGNWGQWMPEGFWYGYLWATIVLIICTSICLAGSGIFARCSNGLLAILLLATFSIPLSSFIVQPFESRKSGIDYTGLSAETFRDNLLPKFTRGADGSQLPGKETFQDLFGILFPATGGIFAGASMSGDLKHPSKAIPKGTLSGLALTFMAYTIVILAMAATTTRATFYRNANVIQDTNLSGVLILLGEFSTSFFSSLMGVIGSAKLLQALARDNLLPGFSIFAQGTKTNDEPLHAIIFTYLVAQLTMLCSINQIASFVTMTYLMTFLVTNLACFLLKISSAPNFRPSFQYFNWGTAGFGTLISGVSMFFVDGLYATGCVGVLVIIFLIIHYTTPPKSWGDVSQSLIYHQVRKYLLRLRQEHVKFWRPQILLFINNPRRQYKLIQFCNSLKKGALFVLGHVIVADDFGLAVPEARRQQAAWTKYIDFSKVKAFVNIAISPAVEWGARNIVLGAGLGGMRPNIVVIGFYNLDAFRQTQPLVDIPSPQSSSPPSRGSPQILNAQNVQNGQDDATQHRKGQEAKRLVETGLLPTDTCRTEGITSPTTYVTILEDLLLRLQINVAVAKGFQNLELPYLGENKTKKYIDLWPIQMASDIASDNVEEKQNVLTTNFDTYTLILQLGCILHTVPAWKKVYKMRVAVFVEYESDVEEERARVKKLLSNLRIEAEVLVFWLASGDVKTYQVIVNGNTEAAVICAEQQANDALKDEEWWHDIQKLRGRRGDISATEELADIEGLLHVAPAWPSSSFQFSRPPPEVQRFDELRELVQKSKRRRSSGNLSQVGNQFGMRIHRLSDDLLHRHASYASASEDSDSDQSDSSIFESDETMSHQDPSDDNFGDPEDDTQGQLSTAYPRPSLSERFYVGDSISSSRTRGQYIQDQSDHHDTPDVKIPKSPSDTSLDSARALGSNNLVAASIKDPPVQSVKESKPLSRPRPIRHSSLGKFSSRPVPRTTVSAYDGPGPSIMFTDAESPSREPARPSIYDRKASDNHENTQSASGFPFPQNIALSFNDLPCRAQHLILNELMQQQSRDTAVLFTTLPSPIAGTCQSEEGSVSYLSDLEVLCHDLPPVLLVHSNSMTVTMNL